MKHFKLFFALFAMLTLSVGNAWGAEVTISYKDIPDGYTATTGTSGSFTKTVSATNDLTISYAGINTKSKATAAAHAYGYAMFLKNYGYIYSSSAPSGFYPSKVVVTFGSQTGTSGKAGISFGTNVLSTRNSSVTGAVSKSGTCSLENSDKTKLHWNFSTTSANVQVASVTVTYTSIGADETTYSVTVTQPAEGGSIEADKDEAAKGATVTLTATPDAGYKWKSWTVTGASGDVAVSNNQFTMPAEDVTVTASFEAKTQHTISWSVNGATKTLTPANVYEGDALGTLPTLDPSDICTGKVFVGWTTEANKDYKHATDAPEFITKDTKPSANTTYYAVFATESEGGGNVFDGSAGGTFKIYAVVNGTNYYAKGTGSKISSTTNEGEATEYTFTKISDGVFSIKTSSTYITYASSSNLGTNNTTAYNWNISTGTNGTWRIASVATNTRGFIYRASTYNQFGGYALSNATAGSTEYFDVEIGSGSSASYSDYTTSCGTAPEPEDVYNVTIADGITNGTVTANPTSAEEGATIILTVSPADGYMLNNLSVTDESSNPISVTDNKFEMPASNVTVSATFKEIPAATLTLSKNGDTSDKIEGKVGDVINLPTFTSDCSKTFVGWDSKSDCAVAPEYAPGAEYTLAAETQTLYAVFANAIEGALVNVFSETFDACEGKGGNDGQWSGDIASGTLSLTDWELIKGSPADGCAKFGTASVIGSAKTPAVALTGNATLTFRAGAWNNAKEVTTLNISAIGATLSQTSVTLLRGAWTEYTIYITEATGSVNIQFEASVKDYNRFFLDDVVISQASVTYSDYYTTCTAALDAPTFTPVAGTYNEVTNVTIYATDGDVYYTLDGTTPTEESNKYTAPIVLNTNGTTTIKAIAISGESQSSVVTATYTIKLPLTTMDEIFAAATTASGTATSVNITMGDWVVTGVTTNNVYVTDGTKGFIIYQADHGFKVGDVLSETVACKVQLYKGSAELTELTATTEGLSITTGGTVSTVVVDDVTTLSGINTGSLIKINGVYESDNIVNNVKLYNTLFSFENLTPGQEYNVTGVYLQYDATKEILPRSAADIEEVAGLPTATISIENITLVEGDEHTIVATITPDEAASKVTYSIKNGSEYISLVGNVITAEAVGTATITASIAEVDGVYHGTTKDFTVTVNEYVAPISGTWELVTDASTLKAGMEVIVAQYVDADGTIYTMGAQKTNNRDVVESSVLGETLTPTTGTVVLTLVDAGNGTFALQAGNGKYLYAASSGSNHLKEKDEIDVNGQWTITIADSKATIKAEGSSYRNLMCYNSNNKLFSCYASTNPQQDIALYAKKPAHTRTTSAGRYGTICLPGNIVKCLGATLYEVAGKDGNKVIFDEVLTPEAGMPYIFLAHNAEVLFFCGDQTAAAGNHNSLYGTFTVMQDAQLDGMYMVQNNKIVKCADTGCTVGENRAYFNGTQLEGLDAAPAAMPGRRRVTMGTSAENTTTGTEDVVSPTDNVIKKIVDGQLIIIRGGEKFNAQGQRL